MSEPSLIICPLYETCKYKDFCIHAKEHKKGAWCDPTAHVDCPGCIPVPEQPKGTVQCERVDCKDRNDCRHSIKHQKDSGCTKANNVCPECTSVSNPTPGPWFVQKSDHPENGLLVKPVPGQVVAEVDRIPEMEANANLISAAPELLKSCEELINLIHQETQVWDWREIDEARKAISKAKGQK